jgi:hypothetical protein
MRENGERNEESDFLSQINFDSAQNTKAVLDWKILNKLEFLSQ